MCIVLRFSTKIYVKKEFTNETFIEMVFNWVKNSPNYSFEELKWNGKEEYVVESKTKEQVLTILKYDETVMVHLINKDNKIIWTNDYVLTNRGNKRILAVQLYSDAEDVSITLPKSFNRPHLLKTIIKDGYGDVDKDLEINDKKLIVTGNNVGIIEKVILDQEEYMMPIVFITPSIQTDEYPFNCDELAKDLAGVAHVLVAENNSVIYKLRDATKGRNPYDSAVQIYFCKGVSRRILPSFFKNPEQFRKEVAYAVFQRLILSKIDDGLSWSKIQINKIKENNLKVEEYNKALIDLYEEEIKNKETDLVARNSRIQELEEEIEKEKTKSTILEHRLKNKHAIDDISKTSVILLSQEYDFFEDEQKNIVLSILNKEYDTMKGDKNQREMRKFHVIESILQQNKISGELGDVIKNMRRAFPNDFRMTPATRKILRGLGFDIEERDHYKLIYKGDQRYHFTLAKTPGDNARGGKNLRSEILRVIFSIKN